MVGTNTDLWGSRMSRNRAPGPTPVMNGRWVLVVCVAAFALALAGASLRPVWHDELYTLALARLPIKELLSALVVDSGPPLHYLICHGLFVLVGWPEGSMLGTLLVRLPSVLAFALLPWVVWRARPTGPRALPWGSLLVVAWLPLLYFGTEARAYALLALVNALVWIRGPDWIERGGRSIIAFAALSASLPLLHYTGAASLLALPALAFFVSRGRRPALFAALAGAVLPMLAWMPVLLAAPRASMAWVETTAGPGRPGAATVSVLSPAGPFPALFEASSTAVPPWLSIAILGLTAVAAVIGGSLLRKSPTVGKSDVREAARLVIGIAPAVGLGLAALAGLPLYFAGRTESMVWALAAALVARLVMGLPSIVRRFVVGSYLVVGAATIVMWLGAAATRSPAPGVEVGHELAPMLEEGDRVVAVGLWQLELRHGLAVSLRCGSATRPEIVDVETVPRSQADHPGWLDREAVISPELLGEARRLRKSAEAAHCRIWLVWSPALPLERNFFPAFAGWQSSRVGGSPIIAVDLLVPPPADESP
jgi:hypothetical protein